MSTFIRRILVWAAGSLVVLAAAGCATGPVAQQHAEVKQAATARWLAMRSDLMLDMAQRQFDTGDLDQAEKSLSEAMGLDARNGKLYILAGRITLERGQLERCVLLLTRGLELDPQLPQGHYYLGVVHQRLQQFPQALASYEKAWALLSDNPAYLLAVCEMLVQQDQTEKALARLTAALVTFDQNAGIRLAIARVHALRREFDQAVDFYHKAALLRPDDAQIVEDLALAELAAGKTKEAVGRLEWLSGQASHAGRRDLQRVLARAYVEDGRMVEAKALYLKMTRTDPTDVEAWIRLAETTWVMEEDAGTLLAANRIIALEPKRHEGYLLAGMVWQKRTQVEVALKNFDRAAELAPEAAAPLILRGLTLQKNGQPKEAAAAYTEALRRQPDDTRAKSLLAHLTP